MYRPDEEREEQVTDILNTEEYHQADPGGNLTGAAQ